MGYSIILWETGGESIGLYTDRSFNRCNMLFCNHIIPYSEKYDDIWNDAVYTIQIVKQHYSGFGMPIKKIGIPKENIDKILEFFKNLSIFESCINRTKYKLNNIYDKCGFKSRKTYNFYKLYYYIGLKVFCHFSGIEENKIPYYISMPEKDKHSAKKLFDELCEKIKFSECLYFDYEFIKSFNYFI